MIRYFYFKKTTLTLVAFIGITQRSWSLTLTDSRQVSSIQSYQARSKPNLPEKSEVNDNTLLLNIISEMALNLLAPKVPEANHSGP